MLKIGFFFALNCFTVASNTSHKKHFLVRLGRYSFFGLFSCFSLFLHVFFFEKIFFPFSYFLFLKKCIFFLLLFVKYMLLPAFVTEFNCFLRSRCSMEMWCPDDTGRDSWDWVGRVLGREHASTHQSGVEAPRLLKRSLPRLYCCCCVYCVCCACACGCGGGGAAVDR